MPARRATSSILRRANGTPSSSSSSAADRIAASTSARRSAVLTSQSLTRCQIRRYCAGMPTLLDLSQQGDVGTVSDDAYLNRTLQLMGPQQLYELWERQQWQSQAIDLERDKELWEQIPDDEKEDHLWGLSS